MTTFEIQILSFEEKFAVYWHYVVYYIYLNAEEYIGHRNGRIKYPIKHVHKSFEDFCNVTDRGIAEGLPGRYWRFKDEIFKTKL